MLNDFPLKKTRNVGKRGIPQRVGEQLEIFHSVHSLLKPGVSGLRDGLQILSRSPSSLVCPSIDSSFAGGDNEAHAGLEESVRNDSLPVPPVPADELLPEPNSKPLNLENFYQSSRFGSNSKRPLRNTHLI